jgi:endogenous inhibitor of DNA gyrase (YacG/DUF329 family)
MPKKKVVSLRCPTCRAIVLRSDEHFPFCSDRCRVIDLGKWASGAYKISSAVFDPDLLEESAGGLNTSQVKPTPEAQDPDRPADERHRN